LERGFSLCGGCGSALWIRQVKRRLGEPWSASAGPGPTPSSRTSRRAQEPSRSLRIAVCSRKGRFSTHAEHNRCLRILLIAQGRRSGRSAPRDQRLCPQQHRASTSSGRRRLRGVGPYPGREPAPGPTSDRILGPGLCLRAWGVRRRPLRKGASVPDPRRRRSGGTGDLQPVRSRRPRHAALWWLAPEAPSEALTQSPKPRFEVEPFRSALSGRVGPIHLTAT
jgi:hypothetical protein